MSSNLAIFSFSKGRVSVYSYCYQ